MFLIQMTGLSGAGKTTLARLVKQELKALGYKVELIDGDEYRRYLSPDLGFSKADRIENIRRLGFVGLTLVKHDVITLLAAINPYQEARQALEKQSLQVKTIHINCPLAIVIERDTKGLYRKALLPEGHPEHITQFTGINDPYEIPQNPHLTVETHLENEATSTKKIVTFILNCLAQ
jgi:adenylylsulfate kinase